MTLSENDWARIERWDEFSKTHSAEVKHDPVELRKAWDNRDTLFNDSDPRVVATRSAIEAAREPERLFMPGGEPRPMTRGIEYRPGTQS